MPSPSSEQDLEDFMTRLLHMDALGADGVLRRLAQPREGLATAETVVSGALKRIGERWERGEVSLAQVYMTAKLCQEVIRPWMNPEKGLPSGESALVVLEDQHTLGAGLVRSVLACAGMAPVYWGSMDVASAIARVLAEKPATLLVSSLMLRSALKVSNLTRAIRDAGLPTQVMVGGAPFRLDPKLWRDVGAHAVGSTASDAIALLRRPVRGAA